MSIKLKIKRVCNDFSESNVAYQGPDNEFKKWQQNAIPVRFRLPFKIQSHVKVDGSAMDLHCIASGRSRNTGPFMLWKYNIITRLSHGLLTKNGDLIYLPYLSNKRTAGESTLLYFFNSIMWYIFHRFPFRRELIVPVNCRENVTSTFIEI